MTVTRANDAIETYIGESDNLRRRTSTNYRNPGATQQTSLRINTWLLAALEKVSSAEIEVATAVSVVIDGSSVQLDLASRAVRRLAENAAVVAAQLEGRAVLLNL